MTGNRWSRMLSLFLLLCTLVALPWRSSDAATDMSKGGAGSIQVLVDGQVFGTFASMEPLEVTQAPIAGFCRASSDGRDDDCDGVAAMAWEAAAKRAAWEIAAAADDLETGFRLHAKTKHDTAKNAIGNIRRSAAELDEGLNHPDAQTRHDTIKNSIRNLKAADDVLAGIAIDETGVHFAPMAQLRSAVTTLTELTQNVRLYRPGRPVFGTITLGRPVGAGDPISTWVWEALAGQGARKSGSVIYLDRAGQEVLRYNFFEAWPVAYRGDHLTEEIELAVQMLERAR